MLWKRGCVLGLQVCGLGLGLGLDPKFQIEVSPPPTVLLLRKLG